MNSSPTVVGFIQFRRRQTNKHRTTEILPTAKLRFGRMTYRKLSLFHRANHFLPLPIERRRSSSKTFSKSVSNLSTAVERFDFANSNQYRNDDSSSHVNPREGFNANEGSKNPTGSFGEVSGSVLVQTQSQENPSTMSNVQARSQNVNSGSFGEFSGSVVVQTQSKGWGSSSWKQNPSTMSNWHSGNNNKNRSSACSIEEKIEEFDKHCRQGGYLKGALDAMESLEKMGHVLDLGRLLQLAHLIGEDIGGKDVQKETVFVHGKIRAWVNYSDANYLRFYTDLELKEFDAFCRQGNVMKALYTMNTLDSLSHVVDLTRLLRLAKLCGEAEASQEAKFVHGKISSLDCYLDVSSYNLLLEMYSNCGLTNEASSVFEAMPEKNLESWCIIIRCLTKKGLGEDAIDMFTRFKNEGNKPNSELFRGVFYTCGVLGDVHEGLLHFVSMSKDYGILPTMEDYVSIVEMFALPGLLDEALAFVERMPIEPNVDVWETLMNFSRVHGDLKLGDHCAEIVEELDPTRLNKQTREGYLPVKASDVEKASLKKRSGIHALLEIKTNTLHEYRAGDTNLPENDELFELLRNLKVHMVERGYFCQKKICLHDLDEESQEAALFGHSERIAFARALLKTAPRYPFTILKNLRVCIDCHNALKIMADIVGRTVVMRDSKRFHHLKNGTCSCNDYW